jgi:hypothetical protein
LLLVIPPMSQPTDEEEAPHFANADTHLKSSSITHEKRQSFACQASKSIISM